MRSTPNVEQGVNMLAAFASVGVTVFDVTLINLAGEKTGFQPSRPLAELRRTMSNRLRFAEELQQNFIIRPRKPDRAELIQLDDLNDAAAAQITPHAFLVLCTSPQSFQAWLAVRDAPPDFARRLRKGAGADPTASGATRVSGSLNFKTKYAPSFPLVTITHTNAGNVVIPADLEQAGFVAEAEQPPARASNRASKPYPRGPSKWPDYARCLKHAPPVHHGDRPDVSRADFTWCMIAIDWGWPVERTAAQLMEESSKARENGEAYAQATAQNAAAAVQRRKVSKPAPEPR